MIHRDDVPGPIPRRAKRREEVTRFMRPAAGRGVIQVQAAGGVAESLAPDLEQDDLGANLVSGSRTPANAEPKGKVMGGGLGLDAWWDEPAYRAVQGTFRGARRVHLGQLGGLAGIVPRDLALDVPHVEAGDMEVYVAALSAQPLHDHLRLRDGLAAAVAGLPVARTTPQLGNVVVRRPSASFSRIRIRRSSLSMSECLAADAGAARQMHRSLGARGATLRAGCRQQRVCRRHRVGAYWTLVASS